MKKILFCAAVVAMATACTNEDDFLMSQDSSRSEGLSFDVTLEQGATTRGELWKDDNGTYPFFWYAETDRIQVVANNVTGAAVTDGQGTKLGEKGVGEVKNDGSWTWNYGLAEYKATQSQGQGRFTAASDDDLLKLKDYNANNAAGTTATIVATYGDIQPSEITSKMSSGKPVAGTLTKLVLQATANNENQTVTRANTVNAPMYSVSSAKKDEVYHSFGEKANLAMYRPFPVLKFTTKGTADYINDFGKLKSIKLTAQGIKKTDGSSEIEPSKLVYKAGKPYTVIAESGLGFEEGATENKAVTVNLQDGTWSDDDAVYMTVAPVERSAYRKAGKKEPFKVVYTFEYITFEIDASAKDAKDFEKAYATSEDFTSKHSNGSLNAVTPFPALDINNYNYLVTEKNTGKTLIVIKGNFSDVFNEDGKKVVWGSEEYALSDFEKIDSKVALTNAELTTLKGFSGLKELILRENTEITANTFSTDQAAKITSLNLPKVTKVDSKFVANSESSRFSALKTLKMPAYGFESSAVNNVFFANVQGTLTTLDMSGVTSMMPIFGIERTISFSNYTALTTVTMKDNVVVSASGFANCTSLKTVNGKIDISNAPNAFAMETANNSLTSINLANTVIPSGAFTNCTQLATVKCNGSAIAPTSIGENAFEGVTALKYMDLSNATTIGANAFNRSSLISANKNTNILTVGATELAASAFANTKIKIVDLTNATKITGDKVFNDCDLTQIRFNKVIALTDGTTATTYNTVFGTAANNIDVWVNKDQTGVAGNVLTLSYKKGTQTTPVPYKFKSIQKLN